MARHAVRGGRAASAAFGDGIVGRAVEHAFANPAASGGLLVMAVTAGAIAVNATFLQGGDHLRANLAPRAPTHSSAPPMPPLPTTRPQDAAPLTPPMPIATPAAVAPVAPLAPVIVVAKPPVPAKPVVQAAAAPPSPTLISDTQRELARRGLYAGTVDGVMGSRTRAAISSYEMSAGLPIDGVPSAPLLAALQAVPPTRQATAAPVPLTSLAPAAPTVAAPTTAPARPAVPVPPATIPSASGPSADAYRKVQTALNQIGYGPIPVDGKAGKDTADAIRRFELDNALPMSGVPDDGVVKRLTAIGALASR